MTDIREQVAQAIADEVRPTIFDSVDGIEEAADAALDVATTLIRAQVLSELAQKADKVFVGTYWNERTDEYVNVADWIREQQEKES